MAGYGTYELGLQDEEARCRRRDSQQRGQEWRWIRRFAAAVLEGILIHVLSDQLQLACIAPKHTTRTEMRWFQRIRIDKAAATAHYVDATTSSFDCWARLKRLGTSVDEFKSRIFPPDCCIHCVRWRGWSVD
jgi:hypothetical protein